MAFDVTIKGSAGEVTTASKQFSARHFPRHCTMSGKGDGHHQRPLLLVRPYPSAFNARKYRNLSHRTVSSIGANTSACTGAISKYQLNPARRLSPEAYLARTLFAAHAKEYSQLQEQIEEVETELAAWHRANECSQRLAEIPGVGPIGASLLMMKTPAPELFASGRQFAAWMGLTPKDHSTGGKVRLGVITRR